MGALIAVGRFHRRRLMQAANCIWGSPPPRARSPSTRTANALYLGGGSPPSVSYSRPISLATISLAAERASPKSPWAETRPCLSRTTLYGMGRLPYHCRNVWRFRSSDGVSMQIGCFRLYFLIDALVGTGVDDDREGSPRQMRRRKAPPSPRGIVRRLKPTISWFTHPADGGKEELQRSSARLVCHIPRAPVSVWAVRGALSGRRRRRPGAVTERLDIHYTPKHGRWLDIAECELSVLGRQCLARRIDDPQRLA